MSTSTTVRETDEGERRWFCGGGLHVWKATAAETGGAFILFEDRLDRGKVTPLHVHPDADETFCMLEGDIRLHVDGHERPLGAGGVAVIPPRRPARVHGDRHDGEDVVPPDAGHG